MHFKIMKTTQLKDLMEVYSKRLGLPLDEIHFHFNEIRLEEQTCEEMEMKDEDVIYATVLPSNLRVTGQVQG